MVFVSAGFEAGGFANVRRINLSNNRITFQGWVNLFQWMAERNSVKDYDRMKKGKKQESIHELID